MRGLRGSNFGMDGMVGVGSKNFGVGLQVGVDQKNILYDPFIYAFFLLLTFFFLYSLCTLHMQIGVGLKLYTDSP